MCVSMSTCGRAYMVEAFIPNPNKDQTWTARSRLQTLLSYDSPHVLVRKHVLTSQLQSFSNPAEGGPKIC
jgi:hypothetical protein